MIQIPQVFLCMTLLTMMSHSLQMNRITMMIPNRVNNVHTFNRWKTYAYFEKARKTKCNTSINAKSSIFHHHNYYPVLLLTQRNLCSKEEEFQIDTTSMTDKIPFLTNQEREIRKQALHEILQALDIDAMGLSDALYKSLTTMEGFDPKFGKSAIKAYKTFLDPKPSKVDEIRSQDVNIAASRCARQIDFLIKRHKSHETEWVRHTDERKMDKDSSLQNISERRLFPLIILLDNVRSAFNVGSIFRTADACGCSNIFTTGITPSPHGRGKEKLAKSALGADTEVSSKHFMSTKEAIQYIRENLPGWTIIGMETTEKSECYTHVKYPGAGSYIVGETPKEGVVLVLGNEVTGVDTEIMPSLDMIVEIPMFGTKNSLNIAACAPVVLYEILRQWNVASNH